jgi:hypothetical protein
LQQGGGRGPLSAPEALDRLKSEFGSELTFDLGDPSGKSFIAAGRRARPAISDFL